MTQDRHIPESWATKIVQFDKSAAEQRQVECSVDGCMHLANRRSLYRPNSTGMCPVCEDDDRRRRWGRNRA